MSTNIAEILQKVHLTLLGVPAEKSLISSLESRVQSEGWGWLIDLVNGFLSAKASTGSASAVVQMLAKNGFGLSLTEAESSGFSKSIEAGQQSYAELVRFAIMDLGGDLAATLSAKEQAATRYMNAAATQNKEGLDNGGSIQSAIASILLGINQNSKTLATGNDALEKLLGSLQATGLSMQVMDGYISGAQVFIDENGDGSLSAGEWSGQTNTSGTVLLPITARAGQVKASGGTDILTGKAFTGVLTAPAGSSVVSPISTMIESLMSSGQSVDLISAAATVQRALGVSENVSALTFDPLASLASGTTDNATQKIALTMLSAQQQIATVIAQVATVVAQGGNAQEFSRVSANVVAALATTLAQSQSGGQTRVVDFTDAQNIVSTIQQTAVNTGVSLSANVVASVAQVVSKSNDLLDKASKEPTLNNALAAMSKTAAVVQGEVIASLKENLGSGSSAAGLNNVLQQVLVDFNSGAISKQIQEVASGSLVPGVSVNKVPGGDNLINGGGAASGGGSTGGGGSSGGGGGSSGGGGGSSGGGGGSSGGGGGSSGGGGGSSGGGGGSSGGGGANTQPAAPRVDNIQLTSASKVSGVYGPGEKIVFEVRFDRAIQITGEPTIEIQLGASTKTLTGRATGDSALAFEYTVLANDQDDDGIDVLANSLAGTVKDSTGAIAAVLTQSATDFRQAAVDTKAPVPMGAYFNGVVLSLAFDSVLDPATLPTTKDFEVKVDGQTVDLDSLSLNVSGKTIEISLTIPEEVSYVGKTATLKYTRDTVAGKGVKDLFGNISANIATPLTASSGSPPTGAVTISGAAREEETLSVVSTLLDADGILGNVINFQWKLDGVNVSPGGTGSELTLIQAHVGKLVSVVASYKDGLGIQEAVASRVIGPVANINDAPGGNLLVKGTMLEGATLTLENTLTDADGIPTTGGNPMRYQWLADGRPITGQTTDSMTLQQAQVGSVITVRASYTDSFDTLETIDSTPISNNTVRNRPDDPVGGVSITKARMDDSSVRLGDVLTVSSTLSDPDGVPANGGLSYQWTADNVDIVGANGRTLTVGRDQADKTVRVKVTFTDAFGDARNYDATTGVQAVKVNNAGTGALVLSATLPAEGQVLSASTALLADADGLGDITLQWNGQKNGQNNVVLGQGAQLTLTQAMVGQTITVTASYRDGEGFSETKTSAVFGPITNLNQAPQGTVSIQDSGSVVTLAAQGKTLSAVQNLSDFDGLPQNLTFQWTADNVNIATGSTLLLGQSHVGKTIGLRVNYLDEQGTAESVASSNSVTVSNVNDSPTGELTILGTAQVGQKLTLRNDLRDDDGIPQTGGNAVRYQWLADGVQIMGAKGSELTLTTALAGKAISVQALYVDNQGTEESRTAPATVAVGMTITGTPANDDIRGALGVDTFTGADGRDIFSVRANASPLPPDSITDFSPVDDVLLVDLETFNYSLSTLGLTSGASPTAAQFVSGSLPTQSGPVFYLNGGTLYFDPDGSGTAQLAQALVNVTLVGAPMSALDIVF